MSSSRLVAVSNQDSRIIYRGEWSLIDSSTFENLGNFGPPLESSLHTTMSNSSFTFAFSGNYISVLGLITSDDSSNSLHLQCSVDGVDIFSDTILLGGNLVCTSTFKDGPHELVVNVFTQGSPFYLDNLQYQPSADVPLNNATVLIPNTDPSITYRPEWTQLSGLTANMTEATNAFANVSFIGNRIGWFGIIPGNEPHAPASAEYSVDGNPFISFILPGLPSGASNSTDIFNIPFLTTDVLQQGSHTLFVRYLGNDSATPLTLNNLLVVNASAPSPTGISSSSPSPSSTPPPLTPNNTRKNSTGVIVGGVVGGVVGFGLVATLLFIYRRRLKRKGRESVLDTITPFRLESSANTTSQPPASRQLGLSSGFGTPQRTKPGVATTTVSTVNENIQALPNDSSLEPGPSSITTSVTDPATHIRSASHPTTSSSVGQQPPPVRVQHEDSGLRIPSSQTNMIELPPTYTPT